MRINTSELTVHVEDPNASMVKLTVRRRAGNSLDEKSLQEAKEVFVGAVAELERAIAVGRLAKKDCIEITTESGTVIKINCPTITLGVPTID